LGDHLRELEKNTPTESCATSKPSPMQSRRQNNRGMMLTTEAMIADVHEEKGDTGVGGWAWECNPKSSPPWLRSGGGVLPTGWFVLQVFLNSYKDLSQIRQIDYSGSFGT